MKDSYKKIRLHSTPVLDKWLKEVLQDSLDANDGDKSPDFILQIERTVEETFFHSGSREYSPDVVIRYDVSSDNEPLLRNIGKHLSERMKERMRNNPEFSCSEKMYEDGTHLIDPDIFPGRVNNLFTILKKRAQKPARKPKINGKLAPASPSSYGITPDAPEGGDAA